MTNFADVRRDLEAAGVAIARCFLGDDQLSSLLAGIRPDAAPQSVRHRSGHTYGVRGLLDSRPELVAHFRDIGLTRFASEALGRPAFAIDAIFFDKHPDANWAVPGHQDVVVPVPSHTDGALLRRPRLRGTVTYGEGRGVSRSEALAHHDRQRLRCAPLSARATAALRANLSFLES